MANNATGTVERLYVARNSSNQGLAFIRLNIPASQRPRDGYFLLEQSHPNFNALYSLALSAAINGYPLRIRTQSDITATAHGLVEYMLVDW